jgi:hypothetical protein
MTSNSWPTLPLEEWKDTYATLHRLTQIVGKIRLVLTPHRNHWWNTTLYVTPHGLTTSPMPYNDKLLQIDFDFIDHLLLIQTSNGSTQKIFLKPYPVAEFYKEIIDSLEITGNACNYLDNTSRSTDRTPFDKDFEHTAYNPEYAQRVWRILVHANRVLGEFSSRFIAKVSPVHFFWGSV